MQYRSTGNFLSNKLNSGAILIFISKMVTFWFLVWYWTVGNYIIFSISGDEGDEHQGWGDDQPGHRARVHQYSSPAAYWRADSSAGWAGAYAQVRIYMGSTYTALQWRIGELTAQLDELGRMHRWRYIGCQPVRPSSGVLGSWQLSWMSWGVCTGEDMQGVHRYRSPAAYWRADSSAGWAGAYAQVRKYRGPSIPLQRRIGDLTAFIFSSGLRWHRRIRRSSTWTIRWPPWPRSTRSSWRSR